jgi:DNA helicase-2/ATP-dependent DNA helicase PcrA
MTRTITLRRVGGSVGISAAAQFDKEMPEATLEDYLGQVSLVSDVDVLEDNGAITLMTLHAAKGLEFPVVAMIAMEDGVLPHGRVREHPEQLEEERRLCFVGITRAQQHVIFSRANYRTIRGLRERTIASRFLAEIPPEDLQILDITGSGFDEGRDTQRMQAEMESSRLTSQFRCGQMVRHPTFGVGRIADIADMGQHTRAVIEFQRAGRKTLILQYARLEPVG